MSNGVARMVSSVANAASAGAIDAVRILGHGGLGAQALSGGASGDYDFAGISVTNFSQSAGALQQLTPLFSPSGRAELWGCSIGADGWGKGAPGRSGEPLER